MTFNTKGTQSYIYIYIYIKQMKQSVRDPHHRESDTLRAGFEPVQNLSPGLVE